MSTKTKEMLKVVSQEVIGKDIYSLWLQTDKIAENARPGQFVSYIQEMEASFCQDRSVSAKLTEKAENFAWCIE